MSDRDYRGRNQYDGGRYRDRGGNRGYNRNDGGYGGGYQNRNYQGGQERYRNDGRRPQYQSGPRDFEPGHQRSFIGKKRHREQQQQQPQHDPKAQFIKRLTKLGDPGPLSADDPVDTGKTPEATIETAHRALKQEIKHGNKIWLQDVLLEAVCGFSHKTTHYALLLGLANVDHGDVVARIAEAARLGFIDALSEGQRERPRLLLRFLCCLVSVNVLQPGPVVQLLTMVVERATLAAETCSAMDASGRLWQPWTDHLVYLVLAALPWCGVDFAVTHPGELQQLLDKVEAYLRLRPIKEDSIFRPFYGAIHAGDPAADSDSGGASFLPQLFQAMKECQQQQWEVLSVPRLHSAFEQQLAMSQALDLALPVSSSIPILPPGDKSIVQQLNEGAAAAAAAAIRLREAFPPRGGIRLFEPGLLDEGQKAVERFVAEEYVLDLVTALDGYRVELAQVLAQGLPLPYLSYGITAEVLVAQMLRLPRPALKPVALVSLIVDMCKLQPAFPKYYAGAIRRIVERMSVLDPELRLVTARAVAHHLSNFGWSWPWQRYSNVLQHPPGDAQRSWMQLVLSYAVRLSFWENIAKALQSAPESAPFMALLGPKPQLRHLPALKPFKPAPPQRPPGEPPGERNQQQEGDTTMAEAGQAAEEGAEAQAATSAGATDGEAGGEEAAGPQAGSANMETEAPAGADGTSAAAGAGGAGAGTEAAGAEDQAKAGDGHGAAAADVAMNGEGEAAEAREGEQEEAADPEMACAGRLLGVLKARRPAMDQSERGGGQFNREVPFTAQEVMQWVENTKMREGCGSTEAFLRAFFRALLAASVKSLTHIHVLLSRYQQQLAEVVGQLGLAGQTLLLEVVDQVYREFPHRLLMVFKELQELGLVHPCTAVAFAFSVWSPLQPQQLAPAPHQHTEQQQHDEAAAEEENDEDDSKAQQGASTAAGAAAGAAAAEAPAGVVADPITTTMAWELLYNILEQLEDRKLGSQEALVACRQEVAVAEDKLSEAGAAAATAAAELDQQQAEQEQGQGPPGGRQRIPAFGGGYGGEMTAEQRAQGAARREAVAARNLARLQEQLLELQDQGPALQQQLVDTLREVYRQLAAGLAQLPAPQQGGAAEAGRQLAIAQARTFARRYRKEVVELLGDEVVALVEAAGGDQVVAQCLLGPLGLADEQGGQGSLAAEAEMRMVRAEMEEEVREEARGAREVEDEAQEVEMEETAGMEVE